VGTWTDHISFVEAFAEWIEHNGTIGGFNGEPQTGGNGKQNNKGYNA